MVQNFTTARERFQRAYAALFDLIQHYPEALYDKEGASGYWSPRQVLSHFIGWLDEMCRRYEALAAGNDAISPYDTDEFNARTVAEYADKTWWEVAEALEAAYNRFNACADRVTSEDALNHSGYIAWQIALAKDCENHSQDLIAFAS
jgi:hypothetical protein